MRGGNVRGQLRVGPAETFNFYLDNNKNRYGRIASLCP